MVWALGRREKSLALPLLGVKTQPSSLYPIIIATELPQLMEILFISYVVQQDA
jgi:hypothetical protein